MIISNSTDTVLCALCKRVVKVAEAVVWPPREGVHTRYYVCKECAKKEGSRK